MLALVIAQAAAAAEAGAVFGPVYFVGQLGISGAMLYWFAIRMERRHDARDLTDDARAQRQVQALGTLEKSVDRQAKAQLLTILSLGQLDQPIKNQAQVLLDEIKQKGHEE